MSVEEIINILKINGFSIVNQDKTGNGLGTVIKLSNGCLINCWDSGKISFQGKNIQEVESVINKHTNIVQTG